ncbi:hypothetical protein IC619_003930 [Hazenella sp. IB182353]|uniref:hypothetical protein n=1 Tax=Polycladospora coralii TaxID=2771432 RepID=UPI001746AACD|nr:hypothetical protein [Polycladospora coralii]MBS7529644.1 hypothetical protein [Polycladospora coralii]
MKKIGVFVLMMIGSLSLVGCGADEYVVFKSYEKNDATYYDYLGCVTRSKVDYKIEKNGEGNTIYIHKDEIDHIKEICEK